MSVSFPDRLCYTLAVIFPERKSTERKVETNMLLIQNAHIFPMVGDEIENGSLLIDQGKIADRFCLTCVLFVAQEIRCLRSL